MEKILKFSVMIFLLLVLGCKTTSTTTEKKHTVLDTHFRTVTETVQVPVKNITIIESPCRDSILQPINQTLNVGETFIKLSDEDGNLVAKIEQKGDTLTSTDTTQIHKESEVITETTIKHRIPKWCWWTLGIVALYIAYRIARISIPILRILPY